MIEWVHLKERGGVFMGVPGMATVNRQHDFYDSYYASSNKNNVNYPVEELKREAKRKFVYILREGECYK